ncbi:MAG: hypothetical protein KUG83_06845 [Gammaproteobacteria bacterium]|nr:hypothetical protein [Gammaproteobacteria bacterium]
MKGAYKKGAPYTGSWLIRLILQILAGKIGALLAVPPLVYAISTNIPWQPSVAFAILRDKLPA